MSLDNVDIHFIRLYFPAVPDPERTRVSAMRKVEAKDVRQFTEEEWEAMGRRIREAREAAGMKQVDLASQLAIGKNQMYRIENGLAPCRTEYLFEIAQMFGVSMDYLYFGEGQERLSDGEAVMEEIVGLCRGREVSVLRRALNILKALFA